MKNKKLEKIIIAVTAVFVIASFLLVFGGNIFRNDGNIRKTDSTVMPTATETTNEIKRGVVVEQEYINTTDTISDLGIVFNRIAYVDGINLMLELWDGNTLLASNKVSTANIEDQHRTFIEPASVLTNMKNKKLKLKIYSDKKEDTGVVIMMDKNANASFSFGNKTINGTLCFSVTE